MNTKLPYCLGLLLYLLGMTAMAQQPTLEWARRYNKGGSLDDGPADIAVDAAMNIYVTGSSGYWETDDSGFSSMTTIKYSPSGEREWVAQFTEGVSGASAIAVDKAGNVYVTGTSYDIDLRNFSFITIRYDASTGKEIWRKRYKGGVISNGIAVDNQGGVYITGSKYGTNDYITIRYDASNGKQIWVNQYDSGSSDEPIAIVADNYGGVYVTGRSNNIITIRIDAATGRTTWDKRYGKLNRGEEPRAIAVDNKGGLYVTGYSDYNYLTIRYDADTGLEMWAKKYEGPNKLPTYSGVNDARAIAVDSYGSVYVTGYSDDGSFYSCGEGITCTSFDYATIRYDAATGREMWVSRFGEPGIEDVPSNIAVDNMGGVYVTGQSGDYISRDYATIRYDAATGVPQWEQRYKVNGLVAYPLPLLVVDDERSIILAGTEYSTETDHDFLTLKYSQEGQCPPLTRKALAASLTAKAGTKATYALAPGSGATSFAWEITGSDGEAFTGFRGQGSDTITLTWPKTPDVYRISLTYAAGEGCPSRTSIAHVHVFDTEAGFVTGAGWHEITVNPELELMQQQARVQWELNARYKKEEQVQGQLKLRLQGTGWAFESTSLQARTLVVTDNRAYFRGRGHITYQGKTGSKVVDGREFGFLVSATDGQLDKGTEADKLRVKVWVLNPNGSRGKEVLDTQLGCPSASQHYNAPPCQAIEKGNIVIHKPGIKALAQQALTAEAEGLQVYPTATADRATVRFTLGQESAYTLELYDAKGALVQRLASGSAQAGTSYEQELRAEGLARGLYLVRLTSGTQVQTTKLVVQK